MSQPDAVDALTVTLRGDVDAVWARIVAEQERLIRDWPTLPPPIRRRRSRQLELLVLELASQAERFAAESVIQAVRGAYELGAVATAVTLSVAPSIAGGDSAAIRVLAADTMSDLLAATQHVRESTKALVRTLAGDYIRSKVSTGQTAVQAAKDLTVALKGHGIEAVRYADGRSVGLSTYAEMVVRTKTAQAYQEGGFNQGDALGIEYWEIHDGNGCGWDGHNDPRVADGMIVTSAEAREHPLSHVNCRRVSSPRPDIESAEDANTAVRTPTENFEQNQRAAAAWWAANELRQSRPSRTARTRGPDLREGARSTVQQRHDAIIARSAARAVKRSGVSS